MGRGGNWPPKSFAEWMVGQNFRPSQQPSPSEGQKPILKVELSEDEASGDEILAVTYPGRRRRAGVAKEGSAGASGRKVRFDGDRKPLKSALKQSSSSSSSDTTLVDTSEDETGTFAESSPDIDTSGDDASVRQRKGKSKKGRVGSCKKADPDDSSAAKDALPHPTCRCNECVKGRKILKAVIKFEAMNRASEKAAESQSKGKGKGKQKGKKAKMNDASDTDGESTDAETNEDEMKPSSKGKKDKKQKQKLKTSPQGMTSPSVAEPPKKAVNRDLFKMPQYPKEMKPTLIMRPEARVMQIEHALETPYDPRPNAFYDNEKGITRVYHGPQYANHTGKLYADLDAGKATTPRSPAVVPVGALQNPYASWYALGGLGTPGAMPSFGTNPAVYAQVADNEEAMRKAASQGLGLSGLPPPSMPPYFKEMQQDAAQQADWQKSGWDKGSNKQKSGWNPPKGGAAWQKTGSDNGSKKRDAGWGATPGWGNENDNNNINASGDWGGEVGVDATWGAGHTGSKKDGGASPHSFGGWGDSKQAEPTFQRTSKNGGSQKHGSQKNWNGKHGSQSAASAHHSPCKNPDKPVYPEKPADESQAGGGNTWGATDNQNSGGWGDNNNKETIWGAIGDNNGEQEPSPDADQARSSDKTFSAANGSPGNGGGDWGNSGNNGTGWDSGSPKAASAGGGDWRNTGNIGNADWGATSNKGGSGANGSKPQSPHQINNTQNEPWGAPPGSFPRSAHNSRPGSNAGGNDGAWGNNGHDSNSKGGKSHHSGPNERFKGAFDWPEGSGSPPGIRGRRGSRNESKAGWQGWHPMSSQFGVFGGSQPSGAGPRGGDFYFHSNMGPRDWTNKPSDQATGPSNPSDWRNPDAAQNTGGKAMNW